MVGLVLCPVCVYWVEYTEIITRAADMVAMSLIMSVVTILLVVIALNLVLKRFAPKWAFNQSELLLIYVINSTSIPISGLGMVQFLVNQSAGVFYFTTAQNHWESWRHYIRPWLYAANRQEVITPYYLGHANFFTAEHMAGWATPIIAWTCFTFVLLFAFYCMLTLIRRQWVESERLLFPIVIIPLEITQNGGDSPIWRNRLFWTGAALATVVEVLATLHYTVSSAIPYIPIKPGEPAFNIGQDFTTSPWNAIGQLQLAFYPLAVGLAFLLSLEVSFSIWFFYFFNKLESVMSAALGFKEAGAPPSVSRIPYNNEQAIGGFLALALISIYFAWPHLRKAWRCAFGGSTANENGSKYTDTDEPMSYRTAYIGLFASVAILLGFIVVIGLPLYLAAIFLGMFLLFALAYARIRAESGLPWGGGPNDLVHGAMVNLGGVQNFSTESLVGLETLRWFDADFRTCVLPTHLEAMKLADASSDPNGRINPRHFTVGVLTAIVVASLSSWISCLAIYYHYGAASAMVDPWRTGNGHYGFDQLQGWLTNPLPADQQRIDWAIGGFVTTVILSVLRTRFVWWPFHPIGYVVAQTDIGWIWCPIFVGWLVKKLILKYGGMKSYRTALPFFIGLVIGDFVISSILAIIDSMLRMPGYRTFPI